MHFLHGEIIIMYFQWFDDLAAVQATGHFSLAAQKSHISQPALSRRIKALEDWAGFALVDRRSRPVRLTPAGEQILDVALSSFKRLADERNILRQSNLMADHYVVRFAAQHSVAWRFFPDWLQGFENSFGPIMSRLRVDDLPDCISSFLAGDVDFLIAYNNPLIDGCAGGAISDAIEIGTDRLVPVCKPDENGRPLFSLDDETSTSLPHIGFSPGSALGKLFSRHMAGRIDRDRLKPVYQNSMVGALRVRAWNGSGVSWLPQSLIAADIQTGVLCRAGADQWDIGLTINLMRLSRKQDSQLDHIWQHVKTTALATQ
jgi:LysR family transcriptional regulator, hypochlorite-specific transcription factor HypT